MARPQMGRRGSRWLLVAGLALLAVGLWAYLATAPRGWNVELLAYFVVPACIVAAGAGHANERRIPLAVLLGLLDLEGVLLGAGQSAALPFAVVVPLLSVAIATWELPPGRLAVPYVAAWLASGAAVWLQVARGFAPVQLVLVLTFAAICAIPLLLLWRLTDRQSDALLAVSEAEGRFRDLLEGVDLMAVYLDRDGKVAFMNEAGLRLTGWTLKEAIGADWFEDFVTPERRDEARERYRGLLAGETHFPARRESAVRTKRGEVRLISWSHVTRHDARGGVAGLASLGEDVTAAKAAEAEARRANEVLGSVVEGSPLPIVFVDASLRVQVWNRAAVALFALSSDAAVGMRLPDLLPPGTAEDAVGAIDEALRRGLPLEGRIARIPRRDGTILSIRMYGRPQFEAGGHIAGFITQVVDMTGQQAMEERLREAQKMEAVGRLAGGVAHDFNNTLTAIGGFAELIAMDTDDAALREEAEAISDGVRRAAKLTRQLLAYARQSHLQPEPVDVNALVGEVRPMLHRLLGEDVQVVIDSRAGTSTVCVDPGQLEQALLNLAVNARDAMPSGGRFTIATGRRLRSSVEQEASTTFAGPAAAPSAWVSIAVSDTGAGIPEDIQDRVFDPFFTTKPVGAGTGLGLAMVEGFVAQSGGVVTLSSQMGTGTTVEILLPEVTAGISRAPAVPAPLAAPGTGETILFVEDEPSVAAVGFQILTRRGYRVLLADSGETALAILEAHAGPIALLLADVILPDMHGPQVALGAARLHPEAAVLYASGYPADAFVSRGELAPAVDLIEKPYAPDQLALRVRAAILRRSSEREDVDLAVSD